MPFKLDRVRLDGAEGAYHVGGTGRDVVYFHPAAGMRFTAPIRRLAERFRVWAPIVPGFDGTDADASLATMPDAADLMARFIERTVAKPCEVVGHSFGGWLAAWLAVRHPALIGRLVLEAPAGFRPAGAPPLRFEPAVMQAQLYAHPERCPPETKPPEIVEGNRAAARRFGPGLARDEALIARVGEIACLTLILHGTKDERVPAAAMQALRKRIPRAHLVYVYDAAHALEVDQPDRIAAVVEDFLLRGEAFAVNPGTPPAAA